ncbi:hypothetical protein WJ38_02825 [Burkholderia ubonensis]|nr:hypothetical protein WJ38_02825 [Burkholderia ubonensis]
MQGEEKKERWPFQPGDVVRIRKAWNALLAGKMVMILGAHSTTEWVISLLEGPALSVSEDRRGYVVTRTMIADDWALEPLGRAPRRRHMETVTDLVVQEARLRLEVSEE